MTARTLADLSHVELQSLVRRMREALVGVNHTLVVHGHIDGGTPLHERVDALLSETPDE